MVRKKKNMRTESKICSSRRRHVFEMSHLFEGHLGIGAPEIGSKNARPSGS